MNTYPAFFKNKLQQLLVIFFFSFMSGNGIASHIKPKATIAYFSDDTELLFNTTPKLKLKQDDSQQTQVSIEDRSFDQELQWRILNLLAQQLFQNSQGNMDTIENRPFSNHWLYETNTFSVNISALNPDFYLIKIIDTQLGEETQLEIPRSLSEN